MTTKILVGDCRQRLRELPDESVHCIVTSPPYFGLRDYGMDGQIGLEPSPDAFVAELVAVFRDARRVLRADGTLWLNLGDSYAASNGGDAERSLSGLQGSRTTQAKARSAGVPRSLKPKDLIGIPWRVAFALQTDGWWLRQDIIWSKPNPMPESVTDRCTKAHEYLFMLTKSAGYFYDADAIAEPGVSGHREFKEETRGDGTDALTTGRASRQAAGASGRRHAGFNDRVDAMERAGQCSGMRNKRSVWEVATQPFSEAHFATFPPALIEPCVKAGCPIGGTVLDPFGGAGTTGLVADRLGRSAILIELNPGYAEMARKRIAGDAPMFTDVTLV